MTALSIGNLLALFEANIAKSGQVIGHNVDRTKAKRTVRDEPKSRLAGSDKTGAQRERPETNAEDDDSRGHCYKAAGGATNEETKRVRSIVREKIRLFERRPTGYDKKKPVVDNHALGKQKDDAGSHLHSPEQRWKDVAREQQLKINHLPIDSSSTTSPDSPKRYKRRRSVLRHAPALPAEPDLRTNRGDNNLLSPSITTIPRVRKESISVSSLEDSEHSKRTCRERRKKKRSSINEDKNEKSDEERKTPK